MMTTTAKPEKIIFDPPELRGQLLAAQKTLESIIEWSFFPLDDNYDPDDYDEVVVTSETVVDDMALVGAEGKTITVGELLVLADWAKHGALIDNGTLHRDTHTVFYLSTVSDRAFHMAYNALPHSIEDANLSLDIEVNGTVCTITLVQGSMPFALFVEKHISYDSDYYSPYDSNDIFAVVTHPSDIGIDTAITICDAFLVELAISHDLAFTRSEFPEYNSSADPETYYIDEEMVIDYRLRPIDMSLGMGELYRLYLTAINASDQAWRFVSFAKMIEYISITVIRRTVHGEIRRRLMRPEALRPDAAFIDELVGLVGTQREYSKQKEAIKRTIAECCILPKLVAFAPAFLVNMQKVDEKSKDLSPALDELSEAIVATRNFLVHAKAAYEKTGKECPEEQLAQFTRCLQEIAGQLIVWFGSLPEHERVIG